MADQILLSGARLHNLKNISLAIPKNQFVVLSGVSGSGKSSLGLDILCKEGQRQYLETLGFIPLGMAKPPVDSISGLSPAISIDQRLTHQNPRSTVGTATDIFTYLRLLYARLGRRPCPACGKELPAPLELPDQGIETEVVIDDEGAAGEVSYPCPQCGTPVPELVMADFSFNKPAGACPTCTGLGITHQVDISRLADETKSISTGAVIGWNALLIQYNGACLQAAAKHYGFDFDLSCPVKDFSAPQRDLLYYGVNHPLFQRHFPGVQPPATVRKGRFEGIATNLLRRYSERILDPNYRAKQEAYLVIETCPDCQGTRLRAERRAVTVCGQSITSLASGSLSELNEWLENLPSALSSAEIQVAGPILAPLQARIEQLVETGAGYLTLERSSPSLSAGEAQRLRLASLLGSSLSGVLYVFDEPTIGTHPRDTGRLIELLRRLRDLGNTVLVIEHDLEMIAAADFVIDFGPGGGKQGGYVVATGPPNEIADHPVSITGAYLSHRETIPLPARRRTLNQAALIVRGARHHNLKDLTVRFPLGCLVAVTGVSGSGKSSLVFDTLGRALQRRLLGGGEPPGEHTAIEGMQQIDQIIRIDQAPPGRLPRSNVATYAELFSPIRAAFADTSEARQSGLTARHFSFNQPGGRCERCAGSGVFAVAMHFLPEVEVPCPACHGRRFTSQTLAVHYRGQDIAQVLEMTVEEALEMFQELPAARERLQALAEVGLGYLQLGQPALTLSGGEAQRVKLARELGRKGRSHSLYLLDEPTTGLHLADTDRLLRLLQRLVDRGASVIFVEHNLEMIKAADWVIDLGPEGGPGGGRLVAQGTPEQVALAAESYTGQALKICLT